ncbi:energy transducer TonB [Erythrobacter crassostreae]|uniref:TonB family protein n=1 Tax=Erythrobacter crassostreae TaxID=2828328 RepID=A0A9X1F3S1_9SPHN|nr:energy transducer TonB [Erythrobacter crassostrea]MBV7259431.1 TonB family protein [Erythrobacter crassostrea]
MSYANTANRANPAAMLGALGIPGGVGAVLVFGLAVTVAVPTPDPNPIATITNPDVVPPPPPEPTPETTEIARDTQTVVTPPTSPETDFTFSDSPPITTFAESDDFVIGPVEVVATGGTGEIAPLPSLPDPIGASPRNEPGRWVTDSDYRSNWIRREWSGVAGFAVTIDTKGRVNDCTITRSTGHAQLDERTCFLIEKRARFNPAKDSYGNPIAGTYRNSVNWRLPE